MPEITDAITDAELDRWKAQCQRNMTRPTIHELEAILDADEAGAVNLLPDGQVAIQGQVSPTETLRLIAAYRESQAEIARLRVVLKSIGGYEEENV